MKIFLSHESRDKPLVTIFKSNFEKYMKFWFDAESLGWGDSLEESIRDTIEKDVDFLIAFIGKDALGSDWVGKELNWALKREKDLQVPFLLPILLPDVTNDDIPSLLAGRFYLSLRNYGEGNIAVLAQEAQRYLFKIIVQDWSQNRSKFRDSPQTVILRDQTSANEFLKQEIDCEKVKKATIIQYSSDRAKPAIEHLLNNGVTVDLYIKDPGTTISSMQSNKVHTNMETYLDIWKGRRGGFDNLRIAFYRDIGTVRAFRFADDSILVGVYNYTNDAIWGHDIPAFFCPPGSENVDAVLHRFDAYLDQLEKSELKDLAYYDSHGYP